MIDLPLLCSEKRRLSRLANNDVEELLPFLAEQIGHAAFHIPGRTVGDQKQLLVRIP